MKTNIKSACRTALFRPRVSMNLIGTLAMAIGVLLIVPRAGSAQTEDPAKPYYDAVKDFSITSNPNGVWSYGWQSSLRSPLNLYALTDTTSVSGMSAWLEFGTIFTPPLVAHNDTSNKICFNTICVPPTYLLVHPGRNNEVSVVRWTAPSSGNFSFQPAVEGLDYKATTTTRFYGILNSKMAICGAKIDYYQGPIVFNFVHTVSAGDTVDLAVAFGQDANFLGHSIGIQFKITQVK